jgi:hypothetical protein
LAVSAVVAAIDDVVECPFELNPQFANHLGILATVRHAYLKFRQSGPAPFSLDGYQREIDGLATP